MRARFLGSCLALALLAGAVGCNVKQPSNVTAKPKQGEHSTQPNEGGAQRFVFPPQSTPFPAASVAMDTRSGQLCKTYPWPDTKTLPGGLPLCSEATGTTVKAAANSQATPDAKPKGKPWYKQSWAKAHPGEDANAAAAAARATGREVIE